MLDAPRFMVYCLGLTCLFAFSFALLLDEEIESDGTWYHNTASSLVAGDGFSAYGSLTAYHPVGYSAFLAGVFFFFGESIDAARIIQAILFILLILLSYRLSKKWYRSERSARLAVLMMTFYAGLLAYITLLMSEMLYTLLITLGIVMFDQEDSSFRTKIAVGVVFGLATLVRNQTLFIPALLIITTTRWTTTHIHKMAASLLTIYIALAMVVAPWIYRNYRVFDTYFFVSTNSGINLLIGNHPRADGSYDSQTAYEYLVTLGHENPRDEIAFDQLATTVAMEYIRENPDDFLRLLPLKTYHFFRDEAIALWSLDKAMPHSARLGLMALSQLYYMMLFAVYFWSVWLLYIRWPCTRAIDRPSTISFWLLAYFLGISLVFFGAGRFRLPLTPLVIIQVAYFVDQLMMEPLAQPFR